MSPRIKKLIGLPIFMVALVLYFFAAAALGERVPNSQLLKAAYFLLAGIAWAWPAIHFFRWMQAEPAASPNTPDRD